MTDDRQPEAPRTPFPALVIRGDGFPDACPDGDVRAAIRAAIQDDVDVVILDGRTVDGFGEAVVGDTFVYTPTTALPDNTVFVLRNGANIDVDSLGAHYSQPVVTPKARKGGRPAEGMPGHLRRLLVTAAAMTTASLSDGYEVAAEPWARVPYPAVRRGVFRRMLPGSGYRDDAVQRAQAKRQRRAAKRSAETARLRRLYEEAHEHVGMVATLSRPDMLGHMPSGWRVGLYKDAIRTSLRNRAAYLDGDLGVFLQGVDAKETSWETAYNNVVQSRRDPTIPTSASIGSPGPEDLPAAVTSPE